MLALPSMLSLVACVFYALVAIAALRARREAKAKRQQPWHLKAWMGIACFFVVLIVSRLLGLEEILRADLRDFLRTQDLLAARRSIQGPLIAIALIIIGAAIMLAIYWASQRLSGRRNIAVAVAMVACGLMLATIAVRTVSLHALDRYLNGPLKLNWVGDIGATLAALVAAVIYIRIVSGKMDRRR